jgi:predicted RNA-binding Zn-ribbon protein involved in translation (DUF1610 family)
MAYLSFTCPGCRHDIEVRYLGSPSPELPVTLECEDCGWNGTLYAREANDSRFSQDRAS